MINLIANDFKQPDQWRACLRAFTDFFQVQNFFEYPDNSLRIFMYFFLERKALKVRLATDKEDMNIRILKTFLAHFLKKVHKSAQTCAPWVGWLPNMFQSVFEVICDQIHREKDLGDVLKTKKYNITKVRC